ncbi:MAG TPA: acylphosphatase [Candidatus Cloacimonadota bacterium]|nr:acylphosphatase [Candidatus Cloacimonadota bacterium]
MKTIEIIVYGRVQGVGFRYFTVRLAQLYNIRGYVQNRGDGNVKIVAMGKEEELDLFVQEISRGPRWAYIDRVETTELISAREYPNFRIVY